MNRTRRVLSSLYQLEDRLTPAQLMPDLIALQNYLSGWTINNLGGNNREIRFSTGVANGGQGAFELRGTANIVTLPDGTQRQQVVQRVYNDDKSFTDRFAGNYTYHPTHGHVHYDDFAWGQLRARPANQSVGDVIVLGPKTSFCLIDINHFNAALPGSPANSVYNSCGGQTQGISVGWNDVYGSSLDGQSINLTGVPNGDYWLEVVVDPMNAVLESDETNNVTRVAISLTSQPTAGFRVLSASPSGVVPGSLTSIELNFNEAVNPATFTPADVALTGPAGAITVTGITEINDFKYRLDFAAQAGVGTYNLSVGPAISSTAGKLFDQNNNGTGGQVDDLYFNTMVVNAPHLDGSTPGGTVTGPISTARVTYNKPLVSSTFTMADLLSFTGPGGANLLSQISGIVPVAAGGSSSIFDINFTGQTTFGTYSLVISPDISDAAGNRVDQNLDGLQNTAADQFTLTFNMTPVGAIGPDAFGYNAGPVALQNLELEGKAGATTIALTTGTTDDGFGTVDLKTNSFNFYGTTYTGASKLFVSTNGLVTFGSGYTEYTNDGLTGSTLPTISSLWDDWIPGTGAGQMLSFFEDADANGTPERLIIQWNKVFHHPSSAAVTFQTALELNTGVNPGDILFNYPDLDAGNTAYNNGASATVGIRASGASASKLLVAQNTATSPLVATGKAILIDVPSVNSSVRMDPNPAFDGDVEFLVTFNRGVTGVDVSDFTLTTTGVVGAKIDHIHATADPAVYEVHVETGVGNGTIKLNLVDNDSIADLNLAKLGGLAAGNGNFSAGQTYNIIQRAPRVFGVTIGDGTAQRSRVSYVTVVFDHVVDFLNNNPALGFSLAGPGGPYTFSVDLSTSTPDNTTAKVSFSGPGIVGGSLPDGAFTFSALSSSISTGGVALDGDNNGTAGGDNLTAFNRKFGDADGDGDVDTTDFAAFRTAFGSANAAIFDSDGDGDVDIADFSSFRLRFGT